MSYSDLLDQMASEMDTRGQAKDAGMDSQGRVCIIGAAYMAVAGQAWGGISQKQSKTVSELLEFIREYTDEFLTTYNYDHTKDEVVDMLRECANDVRSKGK